MSALQFKSLALCFPHGGDYRQDLFCMLHTRVVDPVHLLGADVLHSPLIFSDTDRLCLRKRVGHLQVLNPLNPEGVTYTCHLTKYEERMVLDFLGLLAVGEPGGKVVGTEKDRKLSAVPAAWADTGVPNEDMEFQCTFETKSQNMTWRSALARHFCVGLFGGLERTL